MPSRFDYIKYDVESMAYQERIRHHVESLDILIANLGKGRSQSEALTCLETFYAWAGKAIRDSQIARTGASPDVPERGQAFEPTTQKEIIDSMGFDELISKDYTAAEITKLTSNTYAKVYDVPYENIFDVMHNGSAKTLTNSHRIAVGLELNTTEPEGLGWIKITCNELGRVGYYRMR